MKRPVRVRCSRPLSATHPIDEELHPSEGTLGGLLYARESARVPEAVWQERLLEIARGNHAAMDAVFADMHRIVFRVILGIHPQRRMAEELTVEVFHDVWRRAREYDPASTSVVGWIMNIARERATKNSP